MNLLQKAEEFQELATGIKNLNSALDYANTKLRVATVSLIVLFLKCPDTEKAHQDGIIKKLSDAFESNLIDISYSLPVILGLHTSKYTMKPVRTWDELVKGLNEINP